MAVPKRRQSKMRRDKRRSQHDKISAPGLSFCPECGSAKLPHRACPSCGFYRDELQDDKLISSRFQMD